MPITPAIPPFDPEVTAGSVTPATTPAGSVPLPQLVPVIPASTAPMAGDVGAALAPASPVTPPRIYPGAVTPANGAAFPGVPVTQADIQAAREYAVQQAAAFERLRRSQWGWTYWESITNFNGNHDEIHLAFCHAGREASGTFPTLSLPVGTFPDAVVSIWPDYSNLTNPFSAMTWEFPCRFSPDSKIRDIDLYNFHGFADNQRPWVSPLRDFADDLLALKSLARGEVVNLHNAANSRWLTLDYNQYPDPMLTGEEMMAIGLELQAAGVNLNGSWTTPFVDFSEWMTAEELMAEKPYFFKLCGRRLPLLNDWPAIDGWIYENTLPGNYICFFIPDVGWIPINEPNSSFPVSPFPEIYMQSATYDFMEILLFYVTRRDSGLAIFKLV